jgi:hypothetical protein
MRCQDQKEQTLVTSLAAREVLFTNMYSSSEIRSKNLSLSLSLSLHIYIYIYISGGRNRQLKGDGLQSIVYVIVYRLFSFCFSFDRCGVCDVVVTNLFVVTFPFCPFVLVAKFVLDVCPSEPNRCWVLDHYPHSSSAKIRKILRRFQITIMPLHDCDTPSALNVRRMYELPERYSLLYCEVVGMRITTPNHFCLISVSSTDFVISKQETTIERQVMDDAQENYTFSYIRSIYRESALAQCDRE